MCKKLCVQISEHEFLNDLLLNINIPSINEEDLAGVLITHLGTMK